MQHTGHSSPLGAMTRFNPDEMWKKRSPSLETGENHPKSVHMRFVHWTIRRRLCRSLMRAASVPMLCGLI
jgi:hypothetical protein